MCRRRTGSGLRGRCGHDLGRCLRVAVVAGITWAAAGAPAGADPPEDIHRLVRPFLNGAPLDLPPDEVAARAHTLQEDLQEWRDRHPDAIEGVIALAQVTWILDRLEPSYVDSTEAPTAAPRNRQARRALQRAATRHPDRAALPYWEAQLLASPVVRPVDGVLRARPFDLTGAIDAARRAWSLQPDDRRLRDALAAFLAEAYRDDAAWELLEASGNDDPLRRLLADLRSVPLPAGSRLLAEDSRRFAEDQLSRGRVHDRIYLRARVYVLPGSAEAFETLCRERWPQFRLLTVRRDPDAPEWRDHAMQVLLLGGGEPRPVEDLKQLEVSAMDGISLTLIELRDPPREKRQQSPAGVVLPEGLGGTFVYLYVLNDRTLH